MTHVVDQINTFTLFKRVLRGHRKCPIMVPIGIVYNHGNDAQSSFLALVRYPPYWCLKLNLTLRILVFGLYPNPVQCAFIRLLCKVNKVICG